VSNKEKKNEITIDECFSLTDKKNFLLKIDIEGDEYSIIEDVCRNSKNIDLLLIEFHDTEKKHQEFSKAISRIKEFFLLVHVHGNNFDLVSTNGIPNAVECTFVNRGIFNGSYDKIKYLPIPKIDFPCNPNRPDIILSF
jgi:hypothetical protein